ncbi:TetR/AcrR family transcriptional regulator [Alkalibacter rhizosphaerae]|uniref:TetR/AcrR family transcriptional regulator n=1 Tax=Alkalibacter rhizosphaerae TaxID=2815577 RepID=A0A975AGN1_9FIRM|nr:TetR/AcrR family transcriptional regulator [Alkalibacter rhizosphaerae]QSX07552.1 TetR/AcrR family transcriptional regulator [Alkalibacter rhizosphaerae]
MRRYKKSDDTRDKIVSAARTLFYEKGYYETSVKNISDAAQVNRALISYHFGSKGDLAFTVANEMVINIRQQLINTYKKMGEEPELLVQLGAEFRHLARLREKNPKYKRLMVELSMDNIMTFSSGHGGIEITDRVCEKYGLEYDENEKKLVHFSIASTIGTFIILHDKELIDCKADYLGEKQIEMYLKIFGFNNEFIEIVKKKSDILFQKVDLSMKEDLKSKCSIKK